MDQLTRKDLLPVNSEGLNNARCYICSSDIDWTFRRKSRLTPGAYHHPEMMADPHFWQQDAWARYYRMSTVVLSYCCHLTFQSSSTTKKTSTSCQGFPSLWQEILTLRHSRPHGTTRQASFDGKEKGINTRRWWPRLWSSVQALIQATWRTGCRGFQSMCPAGPLSRSASPSPQQA